MPHPSAYDPDIDDHHELPDENVTTTVEMVKMIELVTKMRADLLKAYEARQGKAPRGGSEDFPK